MMYLLTWGFRNHRRVVCYIVAHGGVAEWFKAPRLERVLGATPRRFKSCLLRIKIQLMLNQVEVMEYYLITKDIVTFILSAVGLYFAFVGLSTWKKTDNGVRRNLRRPMI